MLFDWLFQTREIEKFGKDLAKDFSNKFPMKLVSANTKETDKKFAIALADLHCSAVQFNREHKLGVYKKAKMSNVLKWELHEQGYDDALINEVIKSMLIAMAKSK